MGAGFGFMGANGADQIYFYTATSVEDLEAPDSVPAWAFTDDGAISRWNGTEWRTSIIVGNKS